MHYKRVFQERRGKASCGRRWLFTENCGNLLHMNKEQHAEALRRAIAEKRLSRAVVADYAEVGERTVTNWTTAKTMPSDRERVRLRELLGDYEATAGGDAVEMAVRRSQLIEWRQDAVISTYKKHLYEQAREEAV